MITYPVGLLSPKVEKIPSDGLILEYKLSNDFLDTSISGNNGVRTNGVFVNDRHGNSNNAFAHNTNPTNILSTNNLPISSNNPRTVSFWVKSSEKIISEMFFDSGEAVTNKRFGIWHIDNTLQVSMHGNKLLYTSSEIVSDTWTHIVCVYGGGILSTILLYINGVLRSYDSLSGSDVVINTTESIVVLMDTIAAPVAQHKGSIDDFRIYDKVLTQIEVIALYNE